MPRRRARSGMYGHFTRPLAAIFRIVVLSFLAVLAAVKATGSTQQEWAHPIRDTQWLSGSKQGLTTNSTIMQGPFYVKNTYLRSDLKDGQTGVPLSLSISIVDRNSCAPIENALVEIWGSNTRGLYSGFSNINLSQPDCSSWLRGGLETDADGVAKFETIYPGPEPNRTLHLYAIVRTDWFEHSQNKTVDSDSTQAAAAVGQIFFPNDLNGQVLQRLDYQRSSMQSIKNEADRLYGADSGSWKATAELNRADLNGGVQAHVTITVDVEAPQKFAIQPAPYQCKTATFEVNNPTQPTPSPSQEQTSSACVFKPSIFLLAMWGFLLL